MSIKLAVEGSYFYSESPTNLKTIENGIILVNEEGFIVNAVPSTSPEYYKIQEIAKKSTNYIQLNKSQVLMPGFVDTHVHAPQFSQSGKALDKPLEIWLSAYTFPLEASFSKQKVAETIYPQLIKTTLANGTTTAQYFGTVGLESNIELGKICQKIGQHAFIGKVAMDLPRSCPDYYRDSNADESIAITEALIQELANLEKKSSTLLKAVITPRFIPTCSEKALEKLGDLAHIYNAPIQTHCSESDWEHNFVKQKYNKTDTKALYDFGLLTEKTTLAHTVHLTEDDAQLIKKVGANLSHCPISNIFFANAIMPLRKRLDQGLLISLGTDISGGYSPSMFDNMRQAILSSKTLEEGVDYNLAPEERGVKNSQIAFKEAIYIATVGGAKGLNIPTGQFKEGYFFDALLIDANAPYSNLIFYPEDTIEDKIQKIVFLANRPNIQKIWVKGNEIIF